MQNFDEHNKGDQFLLNVLTKIFLSPVLGSVLVFFMQHILFNILMLLLPFLFWMWIAWLAYCTYNFTFTTPYAVWETMWGWLRTFLTLGCLAQSLLVIWLVYSGGFNVTPTKK